MQRWIQRNCVSWHEGTPQKPPPALPEPKSVQTDWGSVVTLAPGIGIELVGPANDDYVTFIRDQMTTMSATETGAQMLSAFGPGKPGRTPATSGPYQGLTVLIAPPPQLTGKFAKPPEIKTEDVGPRAGDKGARVHSGPKLPRIQFFELKDQAQKIGTEGNAMFDKTRGGVTGHKDFPDTVQPFDVVLYHEFGHAYLSHLGVSGRLREPKIADKLRVKQDADAAEEELVVGLLAGHGLALAENAYRCERGRVELRTSYKAVKIEKDEGVKESLWKDAAPKPVLVDAIKKLGAPPFSDKEAAYIATGESS